MNEIWVHPALAATLQIILFLITNSWWIGAAAGIAFYVSRETTAAEYRWIEKFGNGKRANMPWWGAFDRRVWDHADQFIDWIAPSVTVILIALIM